MPNQHNSIIFCVFVRMQLFNQLNARKLHGEVILYTHTHMHMHMHTHTHTLHGKVNGLEGVMKIIIMYSLALKP